MKRDLSRLLRPRSIALFGGNWVANVIEQLQKAGFDGQIWPVNPNRATINGVGCYASVDDLPGPPDASFIGVNREVTVHTVKKLREIGAGGAICFASGFLESEGEGSGGANLQTALVEAAKDMPIIGPNCYGYINSVDQIALWPDQHGCIKADYGVAIITQSSNIAINMTMQRRNLPIAYMIAAGNQAQTGIGELGQAMLNDDRVSAIGLYLEGFGNIAELEAFGQQAAKAGKPVVVLKIGRSTKAQAATLTHTASLAGSSKASSALIERLGFCEVQSIEAFLETLKILHMIGGLDGNAVCSVSCSGGEASLMADLAIGRKIDYRKFSRQAQLSLNQALGRLVTIANPLDYHTYIWGDEKTMSEVFTIVIGDRFDLVVFVLDMPRNDRCDPSSFRCAVESIIKAKQNCNRPVAVISTLPENISEAIGQEFMQAGIVPLNGMVAGLVAIESAAKLGRHQNSDGFESRPVLVDETPVGKTLVLDELQSKKQLEAFGLPLARSVSADKPMALGEASKELSFPVVVKGLGIAHKSEAGAICLDVSSVEDVVQSAEKMENVSGFMAEEMIGPAVVELLVGISRDASGLYLLTLGAGGVMAELMKDSCNFCLPVRREAILGGLQSLGIWKLLEGYRGKSGGDIEGLLDAIEGVCSYATNNAGKLVELDVNPILVCKDRVVAVDALIRLKQE